MATFDQRVERSHADSRFETIVKDVLRDKESGWKHDYYGTPNSPWDPYVKRSQGVIKKMEATIGSNRSLIARYTEQIRLADLPKTDKSHVTLAPKERTRLQSMINDMVTQNSDLQVASNKEVLTLEIYTTVNDIFLTTARRMDYLCGKFRTDGDLEGLRKGISLVYTEHYYRLDKPIPEITQSVAAW
jgi:hypothetical protein